MTANYNSALAYELISQFRLISSNCGVVHSIFPPHPKGINFLSAVADQLHDRLKGP